MAQDPNLYLTVALAGLAGLGMLTGAGLAGWRGWLALKRHELGLRGGGGESADRPSLPSTASRIEIADLKERVRKLEAIAAGVDL